jgi:hypothetical protein
LEKEEGWEGGAGFGGGGGGDGPRGRLMEQMESVYRRLAIQSGSSQEGIGHPRQTWLVSQSNGRRGLPSVVR